MPPTSPEDILQAVYDATLQAIRTTVQLVLNGEVTIDSVKLVDDSSPAKLKIKADGAGENAAVVTQNEQPLPEGAATEAKQDALISKDFATEVTLAAILAKLISSPATEAKQDQLIGTDFATDATLTQVLGKLIAAPATEAKQDALISKDYATEVTLAAILAKLIAAPATEAKQDALLSRDFATEATLQGVLGLLTPDPATGAGQAALLALDYATEATLSAVLGKLTADPATGARQDALLATDFGTEATLSAILAKIVANGATEAKQDGIIASLAGGAREHREQTAVSTSYAAGTNSVSFSVARKHVRIYCDEDMYWVDSAADDADAGTRLASAGQRGYIKRGDKFEVSLAAGITRLDFLAVNTAGAVYVTGLV